MLIFVFTIGSTYTQNLVPNFSFEELINCPIIYGDSKFIKGWENSELFSADYFHPCVTKQETTVNKSFGTPYNLFGFQKPKSGVAYAGIHHNENLICKLIQPLVKDSIYYIEYYINLSDKSNFSIYSFGIQFSNKMVQLDSNKISFPIVQKQLLNSKKFITIKKDWVKITGKYKAKGGEFYLIIGNIKPNHKIKTKKVKSNNTVQKNAYYFIDDVYLGINFPPPPDFTR